jgi:hypothetical protein
MSIASFFFAAILTAASGEQVSYVEFVPDAQECGRLARDWKAGRIELPLELPPNADLSQVWRQTICAKTPK